VVAAEPPRKPRRSERPRDVGRLPVHAALRHEPELVLELPANGIHAPAELPRAVLILRKAAPRIFIACTLDRPFRRHRSREHAVQSQESKAEIRVDARHAVVRRSGFILVEQHGPDVRVRENVPAKANGGRIGGPYSGRIALLDVQRANRIATGAA
jgi:hypothetical protein